MQPATARPPSPVRQKASAPRRRARASFRSAGVRRLLERAGSLGPALQLEQRQPAPERNGSSFASSSNRPSPSNSRGSSIGPEDADGRGRVQERAAACRSCDILRPWTAWRQVPWDALRAGVAVPAHRVSVPRASLAESRRSCRSRSPGWIARRAKRRRCSVGQRFCESRSASGALRWVAAAGRAAALASDAAARSRQRSRGTRGR